MVPEASPVFEGHFPGHPLVPGVLLTETMAQASGYLVLALIGFRPDAVPHGGRQGALPLLRRARHGPDVAASLSMTARATP